MSEEILKLRTQVAYLEADVERLTREARERDQVINDLYERLGMMEDSVKQLSSMNPGFGIELPPHSIGDIKFADRQVELQSMREMNELPLDPQVGDELK